VLAAIQKSKARIVMPLKQHFYGTRKFAFEHPEGWMVTIGERIKQTPAITQATGIGEKAVLLLLDTY
jgi:hypothetical protein